MGQDCVWQQAHMQQVLGCCPRESSVSKPSCEAQRGLSKQVHPFEDSWGWDSSDWTGQRLGQAGGHLFSFITAHLWANHLEESADVVDFPAPHLQGGRGAQSLEGGSVFREGGSIFRGGFRHPHPRCTISILSLEGGSVFRKTTSLL